MPHHSGAPGLQNFGLWKILHQHTLKISNVEFPNIRYLETRGFRASELQPSDNLSPEHFKTHERQTSELSNNLSPRTSRHRCSETSELPHQNKFSPIILPKAKYLIISRHVSQTMDGTDLLSYFRASRLQGTLNKHYKFFEHQISE
jgi:hypothetical protein